MTAREPLPTDLATAHAMIVAERAARVEVETRLANARAEAANAQADLSSTEASHLKLEIEKLRRQLYGTRSERKARLLEQMELQLEELEAAATEDELAAKKAAVRTQTVQSFQRKRPARKPFPDHLPRERVVMTGHRHRLSDPCGNGPKSCSLCRYSAARSREYEDWCSTVAGPRLSQLLYRVYGRCHSTATKII
jgi:transposase